MSLTHLHEGACWSVGPHDGSLRVRVAHGSLWITEEGSMQDTICKGGDHFDGGNVGKVVIQALSDSVIEIALCGS